MIKAILLETNREAYHSPSDNFIATINGFANGNKDSYGFCRHTNINQYYKEFTGTPVYLYSIYDVHINHDLQREWFYAFHLEMYHPKIIETI